MFDTLGTNWDCGSPNWDCGRRPMVQASIVLGGLDLRWDGGRCAHNAGFCHISPFYSGRFPVLTVFLTTSCPFVPFSLVLSYIFFPFLQ